ncbi:hypothetical protein V492_04570, partial [Pseudogymnoascus sp. VKM F-4246]
TSTTDGWVQSAVDYRAVTACMRRSGHADSSQQPAETFIYTTTTTATNTDVPDPDPVPDPNIPRPSTAHSSPQPGAPSNLRQTNNHKVRCAEESPRIRDDT